MRSWELSSQTPQNESLRFSQQNPSFPWIWADSSICFLLLPSSPLDLSPAFVFHAKVNHFLHLVRPHSKVAHQMQGHGKLTAFCRGNKRRSHLLSLGASQRLLITHFYKWEQNKNVKLNRSRRNILLLWFHFKCCIYKTGWYWSMWHILLWVEIKWFWFSCCFLALWPCERTFFFLLLVGIGCLLI